MKLFTNLVYALFGMILLAGGMNAAFADRPRSSATYSGDGTRSGTTSTTTTTFTADPKFTTKPQCVTPTQDAAGEGRRAFMRMNCYSCHGMGGHGGAMGPSLVGEADEVAEAVSQGEGEGMPAFKNNLCPNDLANLTAYIRLLGTGTEPKFVNWWEPNPAR